MDEWLMVTWAGIAVVVLENCTGGRGAITDRACASVFRPGGCGLRGACAEGGLLQVRHTVSIWGHRCRRPPPHLLAAGVAAVHHGRVPQGAFVRICAN